MAIDALALLKGRDLPLPPGLVVETLEDGVLIRTQQRFGAEPEDIGAALVQLLGDALDPHDDPRGVFLVPDVAKPRARTYEGVIEEIGEAGEWAPIASAGPQAAPDLANMMGQVMGALGGDTINEMMQALASGDSAALAAMQGKVAAAFGGQDALEAFGKQMLDAVGTEDDELAELVPTADDKPKADE